MSIPTPSERVTLTFHPRGAGAEAFRRRDGELVLSGPAGTGKTRCLLEKLHLCLAKYPGARALMARKTHASLTATALVTYQQKVLHPLDGVHFYGGSAVEPPQFKYPNGSRLLIGGLDKPTKIMSAEYDLIYVNEATELTENDWESLTTRLRHGVLPYQQLLADCNPDGPTHWLKRRAEAGRTVMLESRHADNPLLWDGGQRAWTAVGAAYLAKLDALSGVRALRLRKGLWAAAEGVIYEAWNPALHLVDRIPVADGTPCDPQGVPLDWPRLWVVDFGYTNPFVWQAWAQDPDGRLYRYRELYRTQRLVEDHARQIRALTQEEPRPVAIITDHDAEDRATFERHVGMTTTAAHKAVSPGLQATAARLRPAGDGRPRLYFVRGALVERDPELVDRFKPTCTEDEIPSYVWNTAGGRKHGEEPVKENDHGCDCTRYVVAHCDLVGRVEIAPSLWD